MKEYNINYDEMSFEEQDSELLQSDSIIQLNQYIDYLIQQISLHHYKSIFYDGKRKNLLKKIIHLLK